MFVRVAKILTFNGDRPLTNATGFFFLHEGFLYLITARHVVRNEAVRHSPDRLQVSLHSDARNLQQRTELTIPLFVDGVPQWYEPLDNAGIDVAAVSVNDPCVLNDHFIATFSADDIADRETPIPLGQNVLIPGFPLGFHDTLNNLPIVRSAIVASCFAYPFKGEPYFLTDARLHRGMSGSPVIARWGDPGASGGGAWKLLGVHSSSLDVSDRDPQLDERLALNTTWYASLIPRMIPAQISRAPHDAHHGRGAVVGR